MRKQTSRLSIPYTTHFPQAFTLLEILLVVAAIAILAAIVIVAINPQRQLGKVRDTERQSEVAALKDAIEGYSIDNDGEYPSGIDVNRYKEVCDTEAVDPSNCPNDYIDLSDLVPDHLVGIPRDPQASDNKEDTGYEVGKDGNGNITVKAPDTEIDSSPKRAGGTMPVSYSLSSASYDTNKWVIGEASVPSGTSFNGDGSKMFVVGYGNNRVYSYNLSTAYDISSASYNQSFDVSGQDGLPRGVTFNGDGSKMFVVGAATANMYSYNLSTAYDLGSASYNQSFNVVGQDGTPTGVTFNGDGSKMFMVGGDYDNVYSYNLSTTYDLGSASYNQTFGVSGETSDPMGVTFNGNGSKMFVVGTDTDSVYSYDLSTSYDIGTASYNQSFDVSGQDGVPRDVRFNGDGTKMFVVGADNADVYSYDVSAAYDLSSASYTQGFDVAGEDSAPKGVAFNGEGSKMFVVGAGKDNVYSYNLSTAYDLSSASYNQTFDLSGEGGYPQSVTFNSNGTKMFMLGNTYDNVYSYDLSTAYDISTASYNQKADVSGQDTAPTGVTFNADGTKMFVVGFGNTNVYSYNLSTAYDLGSASYNQSFDVSGQDPYPTGIMFNDDGTKMFVAGDDTDDIYSYDVSTAYDISTASYNQKFDISGEDDQPSGVTFNENGTKMIMSGDDINTVYRYSTTEEK